MIGLLAKYQYVKNGKDFVPYVVGEYWSGTDDIGGWLDRVEQFTDNQIAAFDFPLRYKLKAVVRPRRATICATSPTAARW